MSLRDVCVPVFSLCQGSREYRDIPPPIIRKAPGQDPSSDAIVGLEVEVEGIGPTDFPHQNIWNIATDGSLRNNGLEFISVPLRSWELPRAFNVLDDLFGAAADAGNSPDFSWRTSTHVHLNVRDLMLHQAGALGLLEILFSRLLFDFIKRDREKSNFCIPNVSRRRARNIIRQALADHPVCQELFKMPDDMRSFSEIREQFNNNVSEFSKYSSLNFLPIRRLGTLEYRHFHGCNEEEKLRIWIGIITRMYDFVSSKDFDLPKLIGDIRRLNTKSNYIELTREVFGPDLGSLLIKQTDGSLDSFLRVGCFKAKQLLFDNPSVRVTRTKTSFVGAKGFFASHIKEVPKKVTKKMQDFNWDIVTTDVPTDGGDRRWTIRASPPVPEPAHDGINSTATDTERYTAQQIEELVIAGQIRASFYSLYRASPWLSTDSTEENTVFVPIADPVEARDVAYTLPELWILRRACRQRTASWRATDALNIRRLFRLRCPDWSVVRQETLTNLSRQYRRVPDGILKEAINSTYSELAFERLSFARRSEQQFPIAYPWQDHFQQRTNNPLINNIPDISPLVSE